MSVLQTAQTEHVLIVTLNRPERHHAINRELADAIVTAMDQAEADPSVRVVIIRGSGDRAFCAGQDMLEMSGVESGNPPPRASSAALAVRRVAQSRLPVISAINGVCYGGGALLAAATDIRMASDNATFRFPGAEYGLVVGAAWLPRLVGTSKAKELIYTARKFDAVEAHACGFLSHVLSPDSLMDEVTAMSAQIALNSPVAVQESKRVIDVATLVAEAETLEQAINERLRGSDEQTARFNDATTRVTGKPV